MHTQSDNTILLRADSDGVVTLTLNRPAARNALSTCLIAALQTELDAIATEDAIRVVVIAANGPAFCAGHDLREVRGTPTREAYEALFARCSALMLSIMRLPQPVIARVHATATAAGCQLVATCDLAVAAESARFATPGVNIGLFCSTPMVAVSRNFGRKQVMDMLLTGDMIDSEAAIAGGLINKAVPDDALDGTVDAYCRQIVSKSPLTLKSARRHSTASSKCRSKMPMLTPAKSWSPTCSPETPRKASMRSSKSAIRNGRANENGRGNRPMNVDIPVIDLTGLRAGDIGDRQQVAREIRAACTVTGFFTVIGHGVPAKLLSRTRRAAEDFFAAPDTRKRAVLRPPEKISRGWNPPADRTLANTLGRDTPPDLQEGWAMGPARGWKQYLLHQRCRDPVLRAKQVAQTRRLSGHARGLFLGDDGPFRRDDAGLCAGARSRRGFLQ